MQHVLDICYCDNYYCHCFVLTASICISNRDCCTNTCGAESSSSSCCGRVFRPRRIQRTNSLSGPTSRVHTVSDINNDGGGESNMGEIEMLL